MYDYKNQLMKDLLTNEEIVHLINEDVTMENSMDLAYTQVFPCEYFPETIEVGHTLVCFDVDVQQNFNKTYLLPSLHIWIMTHRSKLRLPEGGVRTDALCAKICEAINGSRKYGLGELNLYSAKRFAPMTDFNGKVLTFDAKEFNRQYDGRKYTPGNRKDAINADA